MILIHVFYTEYPKVLFYVIHSVSNLSYIQVLFVTGMLLCFPRLLLLSLLSAILILLFLLHFVSVSSE